ncbi:MAG: tetratricopeptide repeat protein [Mariprofundales bacterium]
MLTLVVLSMPPFALASDVVSSDHGAPVQQAAPLEGGVVHPSHLRRQQVTPEQASRFLMKMAQDARARGNRKQAIGLLVELLKRTPEHARARLMVGKLMIIDGQYDAAWQVMRPLLRPDALDWKPWFWSGTAELMAGKLDAAANHFDESLARDGRVAAVWVQRALVAQERGRYAVAYQLLKVAEAQSPKSVQVMLNIGFTLDALGKSEAASTYYRRYLVQTAGISSQWRSRRSVIARLTELTH